MLIQRRTVLVDTSSRSATCPMVKKSVIAVVLRAPSRTWPTFRIRGDLDERLQAAAKQAGRSVSEEIEHRLEGSFHVQDIHTASSIAAQTVIQRFMGKPKE